LKNAKLCFNPTAHANHLEEKELWNGHPIRFVERDGEWWAVAKDVCDALGLENNRDALKNMPTPYVAKTYIGVETGTKKDGSSAKQRVQVLIISELGIYRLVMRSNKPEAEAFQDWVFGIIKSIREALGFEQYRAMAFAESARNHHLNMDVIKEALNPQDKVPYIKAQSIANKCMANILGEPKTIGKDELKARYPEMLPLRDEILTETAKLMAMSEKYGLGLSVSKVIYGKFGVAA